MFSLVSHQVLIQVSLVDYVSLSITEPIIVSVHVLRTLWYVAYRIKPTPSFGIKVLHRSVNRSL